MLTRRFPLIIALLALLSAPGIFAQNRSSLNIISDRSGAEVFINGNRAGYTTPNFSILLAPGMYEVRVSLRGFRDFLTSVRMGGTPQTINVNFDARPQAQNPSGPGQVQPFIFTPTQPQAVEITANAPDARVFIDGRLAGTAPLTVRLPNGNYHFLVQAAGYEDFNTTVRVAGTATRVVAVLRQITHPLVIEAPVAGAEILINGVMVGLAPFTATLVPGTYTITIRAAGFLEFTTTITLSGAQRISPRLLPATATVNLVIPRHLMNTADREAFRNVELWIDGMRQNSLSTQVQAGRRTIRMVTGGLMVETTLDLVAGRTYILEPAMSLQLR